MRKTSTGLLALGGLGLFYLWRNRFQIQRFLERQGVSTPIDTSSVVNTVRSGAAKVTGALQGKTGELSHSLKEGERNVG